MLSYEVMCNTSNKSPLRQFASHRFQNNLCPMVDSDGCRCVLEHGSVSQHACVMVLWLAVFKLSV